WWRKWNSLDGDLHPTDPKAVDLAFVDNYSLIEPKFAEFFRMKDVEGLQRATAQPNLVDMRPSLTASTYLRTDIVEGRDYVSLTYDQIVLMIKTFGYEIKPIVSVRQIDKYNESEGKMVRTLDMFPYMWDVVYHNEQGQSEKCKLRSLLLETVVNIKRKLASKFFCQSSSIRLRSNSPTGLVWDDTMTLLDLKVLQLFLNFISIEMN
ncbi:hypothetical protein RFI_20324, partial [Reticulomyxa filosa]